MLRIVKDGRREGRQRRRERHRERDGSLCDQEGLSSGRTLARQEGLASGQRRKGRTLHVGKD